MKLHRFSFTTNTILMRYLSFLCGFCILFTILPLTSCKPHSKAQEIQFNAYLPCPFEDYFVDYEPISPLEAAPKINVDPNVWDMSDVDISYVNPNRKLISFTFDDAPSKTMENIIATFASYNESNPDCRASASIFYNGGLVDKNSIHLLHTAHILGMELGNHTHSHLDLTTLTPAELKEEIDKTDEILARVDGKKKHLFRAPFGKINDEIKGQVETPIVDWTIDTLDWTGVSEEEIYNRVWNERFSGGIVLMHDGYPHTVDALKRLLPDLKADGYQVVSVSAMAKAHGCALKRGGVYIRARKQNK